MERFRGIPFKDLPLQEQRRLADQLDQTNSSGKDYIVFAQTLEKICEYQFGVVEYSALKVLKDRNESPTLKLFDDYYIHEPRITLDLVYRVLQEMGLEDCTAVLDGAWKDIKMRHESKRCRPFSEDRQLNSHRCTCESCRPFHSVEPESQNYITPHCPPQPSNCKSSQRTCHPRWTNGEHSNLNYHHPGTNNVHQILHPGESARPPVASPPVTLQLNNSLVPRGNPISQERNHNRHGSPTSTVQLPYYQGSSLKTVPVTQGSTLPGPETGAIPKRPCHYPGISVSEDSKVSPLESQRRADHMQHLYRTKSSPNSYTSLGQNEPPTLQNDPNHFRRLPSQVNDLGKDNVMKSGRTNQCTCPPGVTTEFPWIPPSDSEDEDSDETKLLEVVESSSSNRSQHTFQSPTQNGTCNIRQSGNKAEAERRYSDPLENVSRSDNCSNGVRRSSSDEELKSNVSPVRSINLQKSLNQIKLFLTFADDSEEHLEEVLKLGSQLKEMGYSVKCDMFDKTIQKLISLPVSQEVQHSIQQFFSNTYDWLDYQVQNAAYLVFCISPKYFEYVRPQEQKYGNSTAHSVQGACCSTETAHPTDCHLHAKYIYNQACSEHFKTLAQNKRFFPVLFQHSGATQYHIPSIFKSTLIFNYPDPNRSLLSFLSNQLKERCMQ